MSKRAKRYHARVECGRAYAAREPFAIGDKMIVPLEEADEHGHEWNYGEGHFRLTHAQLGRYLSKRRLVAAGQEATR